ncbi:MAG: hypothetical protein KQ78_02108 [Candidatus Izimaplasma bacterium HR2]|nr:MAG: hypothetical protein KQ78_02108 [Candidatus Izimaplasma bacterium HR2]
MGLKVAEKRMFTKMIIDSDAFLDMPLSTQALYFHLCMRADDDGFINNSKKIIRIVQAAKDEIKTLLDEKFIIEFASGIIVIKHWKMHNYIRSDRYKPTVYVNEMNLLRIKDNKSYTLSPIGIPDAYQLDAQSSLDKSSLDKSNKEVKRDPLFPEYKNSDFKSFGDIFKKIQENFSNSYYTGKIENEFKFRSQKGLMSTWKRITIYNKAVELMLSDDKEYKIMEGYNDSK